MYRTCQSDSVITVSINAGMLLRPEQPSETADCKYSITLSLILFVFAIFLFLQKAPRSAVIYFVIQKTNLPNTDRDSRVADTHNSVLFEHSKKSYISVADKSVYRPAEYAQGRFSNRPFPLFCGDFSSVAVARCLDR